MAAFGLRRSAVVPALILVFFALVGVAGEAAGSGLALSLALDTMKYIGIGLAMAVIMSYAGYVSFGHSMFIGIGGFAAAYIVGGHYRQEILRYIVEEGLPKVPAGFLAKLLVESSLLAAGLAVLVAVVAGMPVLRLRGAFFAIATIGLNFVLLNLVRYYLKVSGLTEYGDEVAFPNMGLTTSDYYWIYYAFLVVTVAVAYWVRVSRLGYGLAAIREDEDAAEVMGVNTYLYKVIAFVIAGVLASLWGVADAFKTSYTAGEYFSLLHSIVMILENSIGGIGTFVGPVIGAIIYYPLAWVTQAVTAEAAYTVLGALIIIVVTFFPRGVAGLLREKIPRLREYLE